jgi:hypothetical protein
MGNLTWFMLEPWLVVSDPGRGLSNEHSSMVYQQKKTYLALIRQECLVFELLAYKI